MTETLELTQAEKEMIQVKREQEALAKREEELKKQAGLEKGIAAERSHMAKLQAEDLKQIQAAQEYAKELGAGYTVKINSRVDVAQVKQYNENNEYVPVWEENFTRKEANIYFGEFIIYVKKHEIGRAHV